MATKAGDIVPPFFSGSSIPISRGDRNKIQKIPPGLRQSIRSINGEPTNCDACKNWIPDIAAAYPKIKPYAWVRSKVPPSFARLSKPLSSCKITLISTSGCYVKGDLSYFYKDDDSYRKIPSDTSASDLRFSHLTENFLTDARRDPNCVFPIDTLRSAVNDNVIGSTTENYFSVMGACYNVKKVVENLIPKLKKAVFGENPDLCLLVAM